MIRKKVLLALVVFWVLCAAGCQGEQDFDKIQENHAAIGTYREGMWEDRYVYTSQNGETETRTVLSVNVKEQMTERQMQDVLDYYEFTGHADFDENGKYLGEMEGDYICYAVFYQGDTEEEIWKVKYKNGRVEETTEEDEPVFPKPQMKTPEEMKGGELP